ncbi:hypothetical protein BsWGS_26102 [Bradybaena similaris]
MILLGVVIVVVTVMVWRYGRKYMACRALFHSLSGQQSYSYLFGHLHKYPGPYEEGIAYDFEMAKTCKYMHCLWVGPVVPVLMLYHPESIRPVLKSSAPKPRNKILATPYDMGIHWLGEGLLLANGPGWARNRRLLTPAFHFDTLKSYIDIYNKCSLVLVNRIKNLCSSSQSFDVFDPVGLCSLDVILRCAFSYQSECQTEKENDYIAAISELTTLWAKRSFQPHYYIEWIYGLTPTGRRFYHLCDKVHAVSDDIIDRRRKQLESGDEKNKFGSRNIRDFLDTLLTAVDENGNGLSPLEIRNEVDTFLFEGHDTTASGVAWTLYCLSQHPEYQDRIYEEVVEVLGDRQNFTWEDLSRLEFTTMCIKEGLRLDPAVPMIQRKLEEDMEIMGHVIPAGTLVAVAISVLHKNPNIWDQPLEYLPERFHHDKQLHMDPFQFIPFSAGSRNCIGQNFAMNEMKITITHVIRNFKLSCDTSKPARRFLTPTLRSEAGAMIFAEPRDKSDS